MDYVELICMDENCSGHKQNSKKCDRAATKAEQMMKGYKCPNLVAVCLDDDEPMIGPGNFDTDEEVKKCKKMQEKYGEKECDFCTRQSL